MLRYFRKLHNATRAQALAEFAVVFPLQLFITLGVVQLALVIHARDSVNYAAHAAARAELVGEDPQPAAAIICSPITGPTLGSRDVRLEPGYGGPIFDSQDKLGSSIVFPYWQGPVPLNTGDARDDIIMPGWGRLQKSGVSVLKTHAHVLVPHDQPNNDYVEVQVLHEFELIIPFVNWFFSSHRIGGAPHIGIVQTARVPKPWVNDTVGARPHPEIPDMDGGGP